jgi:hypothetical protein
MIMTSTARRSPAAQPVSDAEKQAEAENLEFTPLRSYGAPDFPRRFNGQRYARLETQSAASARN